MSDHPYLGNQAGDWNRKGPRVYAMLTESRVSRATTSSSAASRIASRQELTSFYRAIGISAVASATQAAKMVPVAPATKNDLPAFLRDAHAVG